ncbi:nucleotidyltransferase family protein [Psychromonas sp. KJ10-10]|uniref:nucleotidyltransferase family protein n=1 Tax=Psychromonas sp. KJ10-10 TaxID=3391823 RepID=UPI0039B607BF
MHHKSISTPLNDVDVIYFDANEEDQEAYLKYEAKLYELMPEVNWQVRNQAIMHNRNADNAYQSTLDAMRYWPEKETAVAIRKVSNEDFECISAFGFDSLFNLEVTHNPKRQRLIFESRLKSKNWLVIWPMLKVC